MSGGRPGHSPVQESGSASSRAHKDGTRCGWRAVAHRRMVSVSAATDGEFQVWPSSVSSGSQPLPRGDTCVRCLPVGGARLSKICGLCARHLVAS